MKGLPQIGGEKIDFRGAAARCRCSERLCDAFELIQAGQKDFAAVATESIFRKKR